jgi:hypothetical protein
VFSGNQTHDSELRKRLRCSFVDRLFSPWRTFDFDKNFSEANGLDNATGEGPFVGLRESDAKQAAGWRLYPIPYTPPRASLDRPRLSSLRRVCSLSNCIEIPIFTMATEDNNISLAAEKLKAMHGGPGSAIDTPEVTQGDVGNQLSDVQSKGEDSVEITNIAAKKAAVDAESAGLHQHVGAADDAQADIVARTGSTALPPPTAEQVRDAEIEREIEEMQPWTGHNRQHHLLRHSLSADERGIPVLSHFGAETVADAAKQIKKMSQRDLQAKFKAVYGTKTFSNNNNWLRRKLFEAIGMDPGKSTTKKATQTGPRRRRTGATGVKATSITSTRKTRPPARYARRSKAEMEEEQNHVAEALLALADFACDAEANDGMVPGRDDVSEGGLSWTSRGHRDVPVPKQEQSAFAGFGTQLPPAPPLVQDSQDNSMGSMMEYFSMMQRLMMQSPENHHMIMQMMASQQNANPSHQSQIMQQVQQIQQIQQMQMLMAVQNNPSLMNAFVQPHQHMEQAQPSQALVSNSEVVHPDLFRRV